MDLLGSDNGNQLCLPHEVLQFTYFWLIFRMTKTDPCHNDLGHYPTPGNHPGTGYISFQNNLA